MFEKLPFSVMGGHAHSPDYAPLHSEPVEAPEAQLPLPRTRPCGYRTAGVVLFGVLMAGAGALAGLHGARALQDLPKDPIIGPPREIVQSIAYNSTFSRPPSTEVDAAWEAIFPTGKGFVKHPTVAPVLSGVAAFHQIHCVNMLRVGYYTALAGVPVDPTADDNHRPDPHHLRHCFDYLRQSLMCLADDNMEPVDFGLGGATGWQPDRKCRDFEALREWAEQWHAWGPDAR